MARNNNIKNRIQDGIATFGFGMLQSTQSLNIAWTIHV
jgi:hypothetical protein